LQKYFTIQIGAQASHLNNQDGFAIKLVLINHLPRAITLAKVQVKVTPVLVGQELWFKAENIELQIGKNEIQTTCNVTAPGVYIFERALLEWRCLVFQQEFVETGKKQYLSLYPHGNALRVNAEIASEGVSLVSLALILVRLDRPKSVVVNVGTGWNDIVKGRVVIRSSMENVKFLMEKTVCRLSTYDTMSEKTEFNLNSKASNALEFEQVSQRSNLWFSIPFTAGTDQTSLDVMSSYILANRR
jgi:hypothetical protein